VRRLNRIIDASVGDACDLYLGDMTVSIAGAVRDNAPRPDIAVTCDERDRQPYDASDLTIRWPKFIVEVLSPQTAAQDQGAKLRNYFTIPSMQEYSIVDSRSRSVILHKRSGAQVVTSWPDELVQLDSIGCEFSIGQLYEGLALSSEPL
jgi:Uma2 family endonuclease